MENSKLIVCDLDLLNSDTTNSLQRMYALKNGDWITTLSRYFPHEGFLNYIFHDQPLCIEESQRYSTVLGSYLNEKIIRSGLVALATFRTADSFMGFICDQTIKRMCYIVACYQYIRGSLYMSIKDYDKYLVLDKVDKTTSEFYRLSSIRIKVRLTELRYNEEKRIKTLVLKEKNDKEVHDSKELCYCENEGLSESVGMITEFRDRRYPFSVVPYENVSYNVMIDLLIKTDKGLIPYIYRVSKYAYNECVKFIMSKEKSVYEDGSIIKRFDSYIKMSHYSIQVAEAVLVSIVMSWIELEPFMEMADISQKLYMFMLMKKYPLFFSYFAVYNYQGYYYHLCPHCARQIYKVWMYREPYYLRLFSNPSLMVPAQLSKYDEASKEWRFSDNLVSIGLRKNLNNEIYILSEDVFSDVYLQGYYCESDKKIYDYIDPIDMSCFMDPHNYSSEFGPSCFIIKNGKIRLKTELKDPIGYQVDSEDIVLEEY